MNIVVASAFRNASSYVERYLDQVRMLQVHAGSAHSVRVLAVEGDSNDSTVVQLKAGSERRLIDLQMVNHSHGFPPFGSTEEPERLRELSKIGNLIFKNVSKSDDILVYVESDLIWTPHNIGTLIDFAERREENFDIFAPLVFADRFFYDTWGFRKNGVRFSPYRPFHPDFVAGGFTEVESAGSCLVMRANIARRCRIKNDYCLVGWCEDARSKGYKIAVAPEPFIVRHPA